MGVGRRKELLELWLEWWELKGLWLGWWAIELLAEEAVLAMLVLGCLAMAAMWTLEELVELAVLAMVAMW